MQESDRGRKICGHYKEKTEKRKIYGTEWPDSLLDEGGGVMSFKAGPSHSRFLLPGRAAGRTLRRPASALTVCLAAKKSVSNTSTSCQCRKLQSPACEKPPLVCLVQGRKKGRSRASGFLPTSELEIQQRGKCRFHQLEAWLDLLSYQGELTER